MFGLLKNLGTEREWDSDTILNILHIIILCEIKTSCNAILILQKKE